MIVLQQLMLVLKDQEKEVMVNRLAAFCSREFLQSQQCHLHANPSTNLCEECVKEIHYEQTGRTYDCLKAMYFYVCKFIYKHSSEVEYLLVSNNAFGNITDFRVLSIGCGPCTELMGLMSYFQRRNGQPSVEYIGLDLNEGWRPIHSWIKQMMDHVGFRVDLKFVYNDALQFVPRFFSKQRGWIPNILIMNYLLSDLVRAGVNVAPFLQQLMSSLILQMPIDSIILMNDVNFHIQARNHFDSLAAQFQIAYSNSVIDRYHFAKYGAGARYIRYGNQHPINSITAQIPPFLEWKFAPHRHCSSAQMVIRKV